MVLSVSNNDETRQEFDDAIHKCMEYEKEHNIPDEDTLKKKVHKN